MAAKLFEPLKDERKQIGCMPGFIHLFEPNQTPMPRCITNSMTLQGNNSQFFQGSCEVEETTDTYLQHGLEVSKDRNSNDRLGLYEESSRASCSSTRSSSFSSVDYSKVIHPEPCSYDRIIFPESPLIDRSLSHSSSSWRMRQRSFDLDDAVKDVPCSMGEESVFLKHQDSPRPLQEIKVRLPSLNELGSPRPPLRFKDSLCYEERKVSRLLDESKGNQYERIELACYRHETKEGKDNCNTIDEGARVSLESSTGSSGLNSMTRTVHHNQRPPSVVEKLMGLEAMPGACCIKPNSNKRFVEIGENQDTNMIHKSASPVTPCMPIQVSTSQRCSRKDHKWKNGELVMKPISALRVLIEPAPWKQPDIDRTSPKTAAKSKQCTSSCKSNAFTALNGKFEGRLKDIEFQRSSKDLMTLKQMLDAVQQNRSWQVENKVLGTGATINNNPDLDLDTTQKEVQRKMHQKVCTSAANGQQESCAKTLKSPIVVMKPFRLVAKSDIAASSVIRSEGVQQLPRPRSSDSATRRKALSSNQAVKGPNQRNGYDQTPRINPSEKKLTHTKPTTPQAVSKEKKINSAVSVGSARPKMQQKKFEFEKKPRPATTSFDATNLSVPKSKHPKKSYPLGEKSQTKNSVTQQCDAQPSGFSAESKDTYFGDDTEVTSKFRLDHIDRNCSPARKVARPLFSGIRKHKARRISNEDSPRAHSTTMASEQPSPVSVLDSVAFKYDSPSPLIKKLGSCRTAELVTRMSREKLKQIEDLVHKLNGIGSTYKKSNTDFIASLCNTTNTDQRYISKILLASGFLFRDFESSGSSNFQPHTSGHPINPELFFVMEQTKSSALLTKDRNRLSTTKSHRRLIFDSCNEILAEKLAFSSMSNGTLTMRSKIAGRTISARQLLNDMCDRIEHLQAKHTQKGKVDLQEEGQEDEEDSGVKKIVYEDMMHKLDKWGSSEGCMAEVVLDIERMLFKDLVKDIVSDEAVSFTLRAKAGRSCDRKLHFNKV